MSHVVIKTEVAGRASIVVDGHDIADMVTDFTLGAHAIDPPQLEVVFGAGVSYDGSAEVSGRVNVSVMGLSLYGLPVAVRKAIARGLREEAERIEG